MPAYTPAHKSMHAHNNTHIRTHTHTNTHKHTQGHSDIYMNIYLPISIQFWIPSFSSLFPSAGCGHVSPAAGCWMPAVFSLCSQVSHLVFLITFCRLTLSFLWDTTWCACVDVNHCPHVRHLPWSQDTNRWLLMDMGAALPEACCKGWAGLQHDGIHRQSQCTGIAMFCYYFYLVFLQSASIPIVFITMAGTNGKSYLWE